MVTLSSKLDRKRGAAVVIWSSTCSHCIRYDKYLNSFEERYPDLSLIVVSARHGEALDSVKRAADQRKLKFSIVHDPASRVPRQWFTHQPPPALPHNPN